MFTCNPVSSPASSDFLTQLNEDKRVLKNKPYRELVGKLVYLSNFSRMDILYVVHYLSRRVADPTISCWEAAKRVLRYLKGTKEYSLHYVCNFDKPVLIGYADADFGADLIDHKSFSGYLYELFGNFISWSVQKQRSVALSPAEAEYVSLSIAACEGLWINLLLKEMGIQCNKFTIYEDN